MGIRDDIAADYSASLAALAWLVDLGADEALGEGPTCAYDLPDRPSYGQRAAAATTLAAAPVAAPIAGQAPSAPKGQDAAAQAAARAALCQSLDELDRAAAQFDLCELHKGARAATKGIGLGRAALLILCDPPSIEAEKTAAPMILAELTALGQIFAAIGLSLNGGDAARAIHLAPVLPWPLRGTPEMQADALAMMRPFALRRIELVQPRAVVLMGHSAVAQLLQGAGMMRARGSWHNIGGSSGPPARPMVMPAAAMSSVETKRAAWADALAIKAALRMP